MDPRGQALVPLERARAAAEALGWVLVSSYNTASDAASSPNSAALQAMLSDAQARLAVNEQRVYLGGFSGTAREAWTFALRLRGTAGVIGFGAGVPNDRALLQIRGMGQAPFAFFGGAGTTDFNHPEVRELGARLAAAGVPHRIAFYPGEHAWPGAEVFTGAMEWMELQAVREGRSARGAAWADSLRARRVADAEALDAAGRAAEARTAWQAVAQDFRGLGDVTRAETRTAELARLPAVRRALADEARVAARDSVHVRRFGTWVREFATAELSGAHGRMMRALEIASLRREAAGADTLRAQSAKRLLENVFVYASFYGPRVFTERGDTDRALALLRLAGEIHPDNARVCYATAQAQVRAGRKGEALRALECAAASGRLSAEVLRADPLLAPLREEAMYRALLERLESPRS